MIKQNTNHIYADVVIIGAGASGLYCAMTASQRGKSVIVLDHAPKAGLKILMSGGGRCNFSNYFVEADNYISDNPHFCKSALTRYHNWDFIGLVEKHNIAYEERDFGQLFCQNSAKDIVKMLLTECENNKVQLKLNTQINRIQAKNSTGFIIETETINKRKSNENNPKTQKIECQSLVIATGGLSIPTKGATGFGYQVAEQFGHQIVPTSAGLVPFTFTDKLGEMFASLAGISLDVIAFNERISFARPLLFTHRGLSGFAMLQLSNYWRQGEFIHLNLVPNIEVSELLLNAKKQTPKQKIRTVLADFFPKKLLLALQNYFWKNEENHKLANIKDSRLIEIGQQLNDWQIKPSGTEGYRTAEVTLGGVSTDKVSSKTFESQLQPNLYFIGEVLDVTGWLGGYNFQWAWASGFACGMAV
ncbi:MAG: NAD(P)/FAD-dependent oxidoreductase [Moraxellaceae bacterium]|nr:NAD(P)/FAD-dependent oxidoreductase [Moraxellaceae bacterium]